MEFNLIDLEIIVSTDDPRRLYDLWPSVGKDFAAACRQVSCSRPGLSCRNCPSVAECSWNQVFAQELSVDPAALKRHQKPPLPFAFSFSVPESVENTEGVIASRLVVVGRAIQHLRMLLDGLSKLLADKSCQGNDTILQILCRDYQGALLPLNTGIRTNQNSCLVVLSVADLLGGVTENPSSITLKMLSPLKILQNGRQLNHFDFSQFARSLMRRVSSMAYYYADYEFICDFETLAMHTSDIVSIEKCFLKDVNAKGGGIIGQGSFSGDFSGLMPFLVLGTFLNAGKGAAYGMGSYALNLDLC